MLSGELTRKPNLLAALEEERQMRKGRKISTILLSFGILWVIGYWTVVVIVKTFLPPAGTAWLNNFLFIAPGIVLVTFGVIGLITNSGNSIMKLTEEEKKLL